MHIPNRIHDVAVQMRSAKKDLQNKIRIATALLYSSLLFSTLLYLYTCSAATLPLPLPLNLLCFYLLLPYLYLYSSSFRLHAGASSLLYLYWALRYSTSTLPLFYSTQARLHFSTLPLLRSTLLYLYLYSTSSLLHAGANWTQ